MEETGLHTEPFAAVREWQIEGIPVLSASILVPDPGPEKTAPRRIKRYYQLQCRAFLRYCERWLLPQAEAEYRQALASSAPLPSFHAELHYQVTYNEGGLWSLYTQSREFTGSGLPLVTRRGDTWDLATGYPAPLSSFFPKGSAWRKKLLSLASEEIQRRERAGAGRFHENWRRELRRRFNSQNYYLTSEGLAFFFPMYALGPASEGIPTFLVPYGETLQAKKEAAD